jgi:hypothetical protein
MPSQSSRISKSRRTVASPGNCAPAPPLPARSEERPEREIALHANDPSPDWYRCSLSRPTGEGQGEGRLEDTVALRRSSYQARHLQAPRQCLGLPFRATHVLKFGLAAAVLLLAAWFSGCKSSDAGSTTVQGSVYYGAGWYDPWYYGGGYYPPNVIVTPPPERPEAKPHPEHPIARPPPSRPPAPRPMPTIPSMPRPMPRGGRR